MIWAEKGRKVSSKVERSVLEPRRLQRGAVVHKQKEEERSQKGEKMPTQEKEKKRGVPATERRGSSEARSVLTTPPQPPDGAIASWSNSDRGMLI
ncbi:hypothetical protein B296_00057840 [Ensete ventricosum]|uniref:Uncharacterized protein n=1 Tax=Ensete ventricosum TaxID=4639 RepID=A0A426X5H7_ENSVE|nr:hypothetical protein B296_00057840 [Ensete ventricosum]